MLGNIFSPKMVEKLYSFRNSVLVLEDAEVCIFKRDGSNNELVSGILNITDGLLKDLLNISIVVTFNAAETRELDEALLRKGRLQIMHKFDVLSLEEAKRLAQKLGRKKEVTKAMSLADVYNLDEDTGLEDELPQKTVGFAGVLRGFDGVKMSK
jgi:SpoVK/Ycf46/Vps4 family AAA+-type ATPase